jgi:hypothetical protein
MSRVYQVKASCKFGIPIQFELYFFENCKNLFLKITPKQTLIGQSEIPQNTFYPFLRKQERAGMLEKRGKN